MHNIDRTVPQFSTIQMESVFNDGDANYQNEYDNEFEMEFENSDPEFETDDAEFEFESGGEDELEMELVNDLLSVTNEAEMDQFLGDLFKSASKVARRAVRGASRFASRAGRTVNQAARSVDRFARSRTGRMLGGMLKGVARKFMPIAGKALGAGLGAAGLGPAGPVVGDIGASLAGQAFGLELEGLSPEDREFEIAKQFVKFARDAANTAINNAASGNASQVAKQAIMQAAGKHAPGLLSPVLRRRISSAGGGSGTWRRNSDGSVILFGI